MELKFEWDEEKDRINCQKHGISFETPELLQIRMDRLLHKSNWRKSKRQHRGKFSLMKILWSCHPQCTKRSGAL